MVKIGKLFGTSARLRTKMQYFIYTKPAHRHHIDFAYCPSEMSGKKKKQTKNRTLRCRMASVALEKCAMPVLATLGPKRKEHSIGRRRRRCTVLHASPTDSEWGEGAQINLSPRMLLNFNLMWKRISKAKQAHTQKKWSRKLCAVLEFMVKQCCNIAVCVFVCLVVGGFDGNWQ